MHTASWAFRAPEVLVKSVTFLGIYSRIFSSWRSRSMRRSATVTISVPEAVIASASSCLFLNFPVPKSNRLENCFPAILKGVSCKEDSMIDTLTSADKIDQFDLISVFKNLISPSLAFDDLTIEFSDDMVRVFTDLID